MKEKLKNTVTKVKTHLKENKELYIVGGVSAVVGGVLTYAATKSTPAVNNSQSQLIAINSPQTMEVFIEALGDPGNIIQDVDTGIIYASQGQAARELGVSASQMSKHMTGKLEHVNGHRFVKLGKAPTT